MRLSFLISVSHLEIQIVYLQFTLSTIDATKEREYFDYPKNKALRDLLEAV